MKNYGKSHAPQSFIINREQLSARHRTHLGILAERLGETCQSQTLQCTARPVVYVLHVPAVCARLRAEYDGDMFWVECVVVMLHVVARCQRLQLFLAVVVNILQLLCARSSLQVCDERAFADLVVNGVREGFPRGHHLDELQLAQQFHRAPK